MFGAVRGLFVWALSGQCQMCEWIEDLEGSLGESHVTFLTVSNCEPELRPSLFGGVLEGCGADASDLEHPRTVATFPRVAFVRVSACFARVPQQSTVLLPEFFFGMGLQYLQRAPGKQTCALHFCSHMYRYICFARHTGTDRVWGRGVQPGAPT